MELAAAAIAAGMAALVVAWYRNRPKRKDEETPTFRVLALGPSGAGKSVFLSGMYNELKAADGRGYRLRLPDLSRKQILNEIYAQVADPDADWPASTQLGEFAEFDFECLGPAGEHVFTLSYLDYSGELIESATPEYEADRTRLMSEAQAAHAIFGMIDGRQVVRYMANEADAIRYFNHSAQTMIDVLSEARCPIHLIVTKWDLVRATGNGAGFDDNILLSKVRKAMLDDADVKRLVEDNGLGERVIRLIPVSAVGDGFAAIAADGRVKKRGRARPQPLNIEVPIAAVVPDLFEQLRTSLGVKRRHLMRKARNRALRRVGLLSLGARGVLLATLGFPSPYGAAAALDLFSGWMQRVAANAGDGAAAPDGAGDRVLASFTRRVKSLESQVPSSVIHVISDDD